MYDVNHLPVVFNCFDDEAKSRADSVDILVHHLLHYGSLACIVESPFSESVTLSYRWNMV